MAYVPTDEINALVDGFIEDDTEELIAQICAIGENALAIARRDHLYKVQTGNLTSSTGFSVTRDGKEIVVSQFEKVSGASGDGAKGSEQGLEYLRTLIGEDGKGCLTLTMVAGMDYAAAVEAMGLDVLKSADAYIGREFEKLINDYRR
ncbi:MAG: hypothetical protein LIP09_00865 [Bacteroidales bacterium]|nr:hypothetical protein [Bacteroidales bacterium]